MVNYQAKYPVQTLEKALEVIELLKDGSEDGMGVSILSENLGLGKSTVHRILDTLLEHEFVEKCANSSKYRLSWKLFEIGNTIPRQRNLGHLDTKILHELCEQFNETVNLAIRARDKAVVISKVDPKNVPVKANLYVGEHEPLHATALGKVLIADMEREKLLGILGEKLEAFTPNTVTTLDELMVDLARIREAGYAFDDEEYSLGLTCLAVPVRNYNNEIIAAVSISGPTFRLPHTKIMDMIAVLKASCARYSSYFGASK